MKGKSLYVVGIGPGRYEDMSIKAAKVLNGCDEIVGYTVYCDLVRPWFSDKKFISTPMMKEEERVRLALSESDSGKKVALICSGDAGIYGLLGLVYEMGRQFPEVEIRVATGVTAAISGGAVLGAPLVHDFCLISLSDRLTPFELIEKRLRLAAQGDFVIVIYNPESKSRKGFLKKACEILIDEIGDERVCGIARNVGRDGEDYQVMSLAELRDTPADMFSTVFIGNAFTKSIDGRMVTARGYSSER
jgi:precorrin-3B C17-methyltransferase